MIWEVYLRRERDEFVSGGWWDGGEKDDGRVTDEMIDE